LEILKREFDRIIADKIMESGSLKIRLLKMILSLLFECGFCLENLKKGRRQDSVRAA